MLIDIPKINDNVHVVKNNVILRHIKKCIIFCREINTDLWRSLVKAIDKITLCMGSSCFARGNRENLETIEEFIRDNDLETKVEFDGCLCTENCSDAPVLIINGKVEKKVSNGRLKDLLEIYRK